MERKANRLAAEKSPYLLEHAYNPVDWYTWGRDAFDRASKEGKPIFLSIGYSSCHWCHVMARESFESPEIAGILNDNFVSIKVDREARPDVDEVYMKAVISMTGSGGWPLSVFLTPDLRPFYGGTYFPPVPRGGIPSFPQLLQSISKAWKSDREAILQSADQLHRALEEQYRTRAAPATDLSGDVLDDCFSSLASAFDELYGGFGGSPKFPTPSNLLFLLRYRLRDGEMPLQIAVKTLNAMAEGGICDHVGGGFHRYSVDRKWVVPHFEKMLYDNALLSIAYCEAFQITKNEFFRRVVELTLEWVEREMTSKQCAFFSALDADSPEGEGSYYVWNRSDVAHALSSASFDDTPKAIQLVCDYFGISDEGNFENNTTILTTTTIGLAQLAERYSISKEAVATILEQARLEMLRFRSKRPKPKVDDKILVSWNALMIAALAKAYKVFRDERYLDRAIRAAEFLLQSMLQDPGNENEVALRHWYREDRAFGVGNLDDYAYLIFALIELYEASFTSKYLVTALNLTSKMLKDFQDKIGGFFLTGLDTSDLIARPKDAYDGALPSGNAVASLCLFKLSTLTEKEEFERAGKKAIGAFWNQIKAQPTSYVFSLVALDFHLSSKREVVMAGSRLNPHFEGMLSEVYSAFLPSSVIAYAERGIESLVPIAEGRAIDGDNARAYVCTNNTCKLPSTNETELLEALKS